MLLQGQLLGVALSFLRNFGILSGASGVLGALSSGVASAALDDRFAVQRAQQKQVDPTCLPYSNTVLHADCLAILQLVHHVSPAEHVTGRSERLTMTKVACQFERRSLTCIAQCEGVHCRSGA